jgi:protoporphyrinogen/coproporphyrinogen III oxidase
MHVDMEAAVIGGGVSGLCAAGLIAKILGAQAVTVFEKSGAPGGTTGSDAVDGFICDWGSNGFLDREPLTLDWAESLGLTPRLIRANTAAAKRFIYRNGRLHQVKAPPGFFFSQLLSPVGKLRLCCEPLIPKKADATPESIFDFAARRIGREAAEIMVSAMVLGIYGGDARQLSMEHCFPRMVNMEREHGGLYKALRAIRRQKKGASPMGPPGTLTTFQGGIGELPRAAAEQLGDRVRFNASAKRIEQCEGAYVVHMASGESFSARSVVVAVPAHAAADITRDLSPSAAKALAAIPYAGLAVVCAGYDREHVGHDLNGFGFLAPRGQDLRLLGCIWTSSLFPFEAPQDKVLLRSMYGGAPDPEAASLSDAALLDCMKKELHPLLRIHADPSFVRIFRHPAGIPQYTLGHETRMKVIEEAEQTTPGLVFAGNAYRGIGLNDCVVSAHRAANMVLARTQAT